MASGPSISGPRTAPATGASIPAVLLTLLAVTGAVLFGIYGPSIAGRSGLGALPIGDVVDSAAARMPEAIVEDLTLGESSDLATEEARGLVQRHLGQSPRVPDLRDAGYGLRQVSPFALDQASHRAVGLLYRGRAEQAGKWVFLVITRDEGHYLAFDSLGRPRPMVADTAYEGELPARPGGPGAAVAWSDGTLLRVACVEGEDEIDALRDPLGAP